jgi:phosphoribosylanthranilate isomerase
MFVKVCCITRVEDALHAVENGASALGFIFWPRSPRYITPERVRQIVSALPADVATVGVFVDADGDDIRRTAESSGINTVQLNDESTPDVMARIGFPVLRAVTLPSSARVAAEWPEDVTLLLDAHDPVRRGGTGMTVDWQQAAELARRRRLVLAGGLRPSNVAEAIAVVRPYGVDVCSGVESTPGVKDHDKVAQFLANAKSAFVASQSSGRLGPES